MIHRTGIINLDNSSGLGTHWVAYAIDPRGIIYFDSYGLAPPKEFMRYIKPFPVALFNAIPAAVSTAPNAAAFATTGAAAEIIAGIAANSGNIPPDLIMLAIADFDKSI